jgi:hypothetical protein
MAANSAMGDRGEPAPSISSRVTLTLYPAAWLSLWLE